MRRTLLAVVVLLSAVSIVGCGVHGPQSDRAMVSDFESHRAQYRELLGMFQADFVKLGSISTMYGPLDWERTKAALDAPRLTRYRSLMRQLHVSMVERGFDPNGGRADSTVLFTTDEGGIVPAGYSKGLLFASKPPSPLVPDTAAAAASRSYRHIVGNWYIDFYSN